MTLAEVLDYLKFTIYGTVSGFIFCPQCTTGLDKSKMSNFLCILECCITYFLRISIHWSEFCPLLALLQVPSYISRSVAGSYDNEAVAIFALVFTFYLYVKVMVTWCFFSLLLVNVALFTDLFVNNTQTLNTGSLFYATLNALSYFYMVSLLILIRCFKMNIMIMY
jgi:hypothetical protein